MKFLTSLMFLLTTLPVFAQTESFTIADVFGVSHQEDLHIPIHCSHNEDMVGFTVVGSWPTNEMQLLSIVASPEFDSINEGHGIDFFFTSLDEPTATFVCAAIFETVQPYIGESVPPATDTHLIDFVVRLTDNLLPGDVLGGIHLQNGIGVGGGVGPLLNNIYTSPPGISHLVTMNDGSITIVEGFLRGDADSNGVVNGIIDGLFLLNWQFIPGSAAPPCMDAADADDSGNVNGLVDGLFILQFVFAGGSPPPAPYPSAGPDPTPDSLPGC